MKINRVRGVMVALAMALIGVLGLFIVDNYAVVTASTPVAATPTPWVEPSPKPVCAVGTPLYYANVPVAAKEGPWSFGPPAAVSRHDTPFRPIVRVDKEQVEADFVMRVCSDPALYKAVMAALDGNDPNRPLDRPAWQAGVEQLTEALQFDEGRFERRSETDDGYTLYMKPGTTPSQRPFVGASRPRPGSG